MRHTWKISARFEKCATVAKMLSKEQTWKNKPHFEKSATLGKMRRLGKMCHILKKPAISKKCITLAKLCHT